MQPTPMTGKPTLGVRAALGRPGLVPAADARHAETEPSAAVLSFALGGGPQRCRQQSPAPQDHLQRFMEVDAAVLGLDALGRICSCTPAAVALFGGAAAAELLGQPIGRLVPAIPIRESTPGYNGAYVAFWFGQRQWWAYEAVDGKGRPVTVAVTVLPVEYADGCGYLMSLQPQFQQLGALDMDVR